MFTGCGQRLACFLVFAQALVSCLAQLFVFLQFPRDLLREHFCIFGVINYWACLVRGGIPLDSTLSDEELTRLRRFHTCGP
jgi:hypothetical protein